MLHLPCSLRSFGLCCATLSGLLGYAQTAGPRNPTSAGNNNGVGSTAWTNPTRNATSNDSYATVSTKGISQYLTATNYGFSIPSPSGIAGIQLDVERRSNSPLNVTLTGAWTTGLSRTIPAGINRCLIVAYAQENGNNSRDLTALTYGGRSMTQIAQQSCGNTNGFMGRIEVWMLLEADIAMASSTTITPTFGAYTALEYCDVFTSALFTNVDQFSPVPSVQSTGAISPPNTANPHQLGAAISTSVGSMAINLVTSGNNTSPASTNGGTGTYTINSSYTEGTDIYFANTGVAPNSGACFQTAHKAINANGSERPSCTLNGSVNRWAMIGFTLQRARELDHRVQLINGGSIGGTDLASSVTWPTADAYITYGGPTQLWGRSWITSEINATGFGAAIAARVQNGEARVDHMRISVYYYSTLPVELIDFQARTEGHSVKLEWATATEQDNDHFVVLRSADAIHFEEITRVQGAGNSQTLLRYAAYDEHPVAGTNYYRLVQVDHDGTQDPSALVSVDFKHDGPSIFPNPTTDGTVTIFDEDVRTFEVSVYDPSMRLISTSQLTTGEPTLLLRDLPNGTYTILTRSEGMERVRRIVKTSRGV